MVKLRCGNCRYDVEIEGSGAAVCGVGKLCPSCNRGSLSVWWDVKKHVVANFHPFNIFQGIPK